MEMEVARVTATGACGLFRETKKATNQARRFSGGVQAEAWSRFLLGPTWCLRRPVPEAKEERRASWCRCFLLLFICLFYLWYNKSMDWPPIRHKE